LLVSKILGSVGSGGKNLPGDVTLIQTLLQRHKFWLPDDPPKITGVFDKATGDAIRGFQEKPGALLRPDGVVSPHGFTLRWLDRDSIPALKHRVFMPVCWGRTGDGLTIDDFDSAATTLGCETAAIRAVARVESGRSAWQDEGVPSILFERHKFHKHTQGAFDTSHPDISNRHAGGYGPASKQYPKLRRAAMLDESAALKSASWGAFQILGENYIDAGFGSVDAFVDAMLASERRHLDAFVSFIAASAAKKKALQDRDWPTFARLYNGPGYAKFDYDGKIARAYELFSKEAGARRGPQ
jgi:N-acetylmuramidase/Putative peptidoglycan binding domain